MPQTVKFEQSFPDMYPVEKKSFYHDNIQEVSFEFEGTGFILKGEAKKIKDDSPEHAYYNKDSVVQIDTATMPHGWTNFYRTDDVSATAYFYLDKPFDNLPVLQAGSIRTTHLRSEK